MSLEVCCECNREFLTEADDYVVTPREGYALRCIKCYFKKLQTENERIKTNLKNEKHENKLFEVVKYFYTPSNENNTFKPLIVEKTRYDRESWCIRYGSYVANDSLELELEPSPSNRSYEFISRTRFSLEDAFRIAEATYLKSIKDKKW